MYFTRRAFYRGCRPVRSFLYDFFFFSKLVFFPFSSAVPRRQITFKSVSRNRSRARHAVGRIVADRTRAVKRRVFLARHADLLHVRPTVRRTTGKRRMPNVTGTKTPPPPRPPRRPGARRTTRPARLRWRDEGTRAPIRKSIGTDVFARSSPRVFPFLFRFFFLISPRLFRFFRFTYVRLLWPPGPVHVCVSLLVDDGLTRAAHPTGRRGYVSPRKRITSGRHRVNVARHYSNAAFPNKRLRRRRRRPLESILNRNPVFFFDSFHLNEFLHTDKTQYHGLSLPRTIQRVILTYIITIIYYIIIRLRLYYRRI